MRRGLPRARGAAEALAGRSNANASSRPRRRGAARRGRGRGAAANVLRQPARRSGTRGRGAATCTRATEALLDEIERLADRDPRGRRERRAPRAARGRRRRDRRRRPRRPRLLLEGGADRRGDPGDASPRTSPRSRPARGRPPGLAVVIVGKDAPSTVYLEQILRGCAKVGIDGRFVESRGRGDRRLPCGRRSERSTTTRSSTAIIVQMPLPGAIRLSHGHRRDRPGQGHRRDPPAQRRPAAASATTASCRRPPTPRSRSSSGRGSRSRARTPSSSAGRRSSACRPRSSCSREDATVTVCHSRTRDLAPPRPAADIVVVAAGRAGPRHRARCSSPARSSSTSGSTSSTARSSATSTSRRRARSPRRSRPVPGGVGPLTNALLLTHLIRAAAGRAGRRRPRTPGPASTAGSRSMSPMSFPSDLEIARSVTPAADRRRRPRARPRATTSSSCTARPRPRSRSRRSRRLEAAAPARQVRRRHGDHPDAARRGQVDDDGRARPGPQPDRPQGRGHHPPAVARARSSGSRAAPPAAATARSSRWRTSTST